MLKILGHPTIRYLPLALSFSLIAFVIFGKPAEQAPCGDGLDGAMPPPGCEAGPVNSDERKAE